MAEPTREALTFPSAQARRIDPYIHHGPRSTKPFVTLTFATSLDSNLSIAPGLQTLISGPESKAMTHYLRSKHDAIVIGAGTAIADDPSLNCRIWGVGGYGEEGLKGQPRPVVVDPQGRWDLSSDNKVVKLAKQGRGRAPWVVTNEASAKDRQKATEEVGGKVIPIRPADSGKIDWNDILAALWKEGIKSVMIEGGGMVINDLLSPAYFGLVDSVIMTIAPTWLGQNGVQVCPAPRFENDWRVPVGRLTDVKWVPLGEDVILCGKPSLHIEQ